MPPARAFYGDAFCRIDKTIFSVLYKDKASRFNLLVNICVSLEILKELFGQSDEKFLGSFILKI